GSKLAWLSSRRCRIRSRSSLKSSFSEYIAERLHPTVLPVDPNHVSGRLDDEVTLQRVAPKGLEHVLSLQPEQPPVLMRQERVVPDALEVEVVGEVRDHVRFDRERASGASRARGRAEQPEVGAPTREVRARTH